MPDCTASNNSNNTTTVRWAGQGMKSQAQMIVDRSSAKTPQNEHGNVMQCVGVVSGATP
jgi:hypothetical protein